MPYVAVSETCSFFVQKLVFLLFKYALKHYHFVRVGFSTVLVMS